jgi:hypothetical protein
LRFDFMYLFDAFCQNIYRDVDISMKYLNYIL